MPNTSKKILLIEDEEDLRNLYYDLLIIEGYEVAQTSNGESGLEYMTHNGYDLVLLDIMLPRIDGFEILKRVKETKSISQPLDTIVLLTNLSQDQTIAKATEFGVRGYMIKSDYNPQQFIDQVKEFLKNSKKEK